MTGLRAALAAGLLMASVTGAEAASQWYVSGGYDYFSDGLNGGDINVGWQISRYWALEGGLTIGATTVTDSYGDTTAAAVAELTVDGYGFLPLTRSVSLFGTAGLASVGIAASDSYTTASAHGGAARIGAGLDVRMSREVHLRATGRYQLISVAGLSASDATVSAQLVYFF